MVDSFRSCTLPNIFPFCPLPGLTRSPLCVTTTDLLSTPTSIFLELISPLSSRFAHLISSLTSQLMYLTNISNFKRPIPEMKPGSQPYPKASLSQNEITIYPVARTRNSRNHNWFLNSPYSLYPINQQTLLTYHLIMRCGLKRKWTLIQDN